MIMLFSTVSDGVATTDALCGKTCGTNSSTQNFCNDPSLWCGSSYVNVGGNDTYLNCMPLQGDCRTITTSTYIVCFQNESDCQNRNWTVSSSGREFSAGMKCSAVGAKTTVYGGYNMWRCGPGYYNTKGTEFTAGSSSSSITCDLCPAGTFGATSGLSTSTCSGKCAKGSYTSTAGQTACTACQNGTTTSAAGQTSCDATCANYGYVNAWNTATWNSGNTMTNLCSAKNCKAGMRKSSTTCAPCAAGTYMASSAHTNTACTTCPRHTSNDGSGVGGTTLYAGSTSVTECYLTANSGATWSDTTGEYDCPTENASYTN